MATTHQAPMRATAGLIRQIVCFCLQHGARLYRDWPADRIFKYFAFHFLTGDLLVTFEGTEIAGALIGWRECAATIEERHLKKEYHFNWQVPTDGGDALMIGDVIIDTRRPDAGAVRTRLLQEASARWPDWKKRRLFTHRRGRLVELSQAAIARFFHEQPIHS